MSGIPGLDSSSEPSKSQIAQAKAAGVLGWSGYLGPGAYHDWASSTFEAVRAAGMFTIAFVFPGSSAGPMRQQADAVGALLCLDNAIGDTPNPYDPAVATWMALARQNGALAGMYGQAAVLEHWVGHYDFAVVCGTGNTTSNNPLGLSVPCGNQYQNTHTEFGMSVDRGLYDPWFLNQSDQEETTMFVASVEGTATQYLVTESCIVGIPDGQTAAAYESVGIKTTNPPLTSAGFANLQKALPMVPQSASGTPALPGSISVSGTLEVKS